jgi:hypothetical protein
MFYGRFLICVSESSWLIKIVWFGVSGVVSHDKSACCSVYLINTITPIRWTFLMRVGNHMRVVTRTITSTFIGLIYKFIDAFPIGNVSRVVWEPTAIVLVFLLLILVAKGLYFQKLLDDMLSPLSNLRNSRWRPRWPPLPINDHNSYLFTLGRCFLSLYLGFRGHAIH